VCLSFLSLFFFIYLFIFYIDNNNNGRKDTLHTQEIQVPSDIYPGGWSKSRGTQSIPTSLPHLFAADKTASFHRSVSTSACHSVMDTEFLSKGQKPPKTTPWKRAKPALFLAK
jgi:hypothetical protein